MNESAIARRKAEYEAKKQAQLLKEKELQKKPPTTTKTRITQNSILNNIRIGNEDTELEKFAKSHNLERELNLMPYIQRNFLANNGHGLRVLMALHTNTPISIPNEQTTQLQRAIQKLNAQKIIEVNENTSKLTHTGKVIARAFELLASNKREVPRKLNQLSEINFLKLHFLIDKNNQITPDGNKIKAALHATNLITTPGVGSEPNLRHTPREPIANKIRIDSTPEGLRRLEARLGSVPGLNEPLGPKRAKTHAFNLPPLTPERRTEAYTPTRGASSKINTVAKPVQPSGRFTRLVRQVTGFFSGKRK